MLLCPGTKSSPPEGIHIQEVLFTKRKGKCTTIPVPIVNSTKHSVALSARTKVGHIEMVKAVYPAAVQPTKERQAAQTRRRPQEKHHLIRLAESTPTYNPIQSNTE